MKNLSSDTHEHDPALDKDLFDLLSKEGMDPGESPGDDNESTVGVNPNQYPDPEDSGAGTIDASWGDKDDTGDGTGSPNDAVHHSTAVIKKFREGREEMLDKLFDGKAMSDGAEQKLMGSHLSHAASGQFQSSSPQLKTKSSIQKTSSASQTLLERVRATFGRH